jgi:hypothetical protein
LLPVELYSDGILLRQPAISYALGCVGFINGRVAVPGFYSQEISSTPASDSVLKPPLNLGRS